MSMKQLMDLSREEQSAFLDSFDIVLSDVDGVLRTLNGLPMEGAVEGVKALRNLRKKIYLITNNSTVPLSMFISRMTKLEVTKEEVIRPANVISWYLKKIKFDKEIYVVGFKSLRDELEEGGWRVVYDEVQAVAETAGSIQQTFKNLRPNVGAVVLDFAINLNYTMLQKCVQYIENNNAEFLVGAWDPIIPYAGFNFIGPSNFSQAITEVTGKSPKILSKPGHELIEYLQDNIGPYDPSRVLFIGDSLVTDMKFASNAGFQKLLTLSGYTTEVDLKNGIYDEKSRPDYVVDSIKVFDTLVQNSKL